jgi:hypothetical protein
VCAMVIGAKTPHAPARRRKRVSPDVRRAGGLLERRIVRLVLFASLVDAHV